MNYDTIKITVKDETKEYIPIECHKKLVTEILDASNLQQLVELIDVRLSKPYSDGNPYFVRLKNTRFKLISTISSIGEK